MELAEVVNTQYAFPVGIVLICAVFVFAFGFKSSSPPSFGQIVHAADDRKTAGKKRKLKDKKSVQNSISTSNTDDGKRGKAENSSKSATGKLSKQAKSLKDETNKGQAATIKTQAAKKKNTSQKENVNESTLLDIKNSPKDGKESSGRKKTQPSNDPSIQAELKAKSQEKRLLKEKNYNIQQVKTNKQRASDDKQKSTKISLKTKKNEEKPIDFDDGEWEQAVSRKEKKSRRREEDLAAGGSGGVAPITANKATVISESPNYSSSTGTALASNLSGDSSIHHGDSAKDVIFGSDDSDKHHIDTGVPGAVSMDMHISGVSEENKSVNGVGDLYVSDTSSKEDKPKLEKSSKSKGKNKEASTPSAQKDVSPVESGGSGGGNTTQPIDETSKSKKKKKPSSGAVTNKDGKSPLVENTKLLDADTAGPNAGEQDVASTSSAAAKPNVTTGVIFDELGDIWKEAKVPKKNKKKVRKDQ